MHLRRYTFAPFLTLATFLAACTTQNSLEDELVVIEENCRAQIAAADLRKISMHTSPLDVRRLTPSMLNDRTFLSDEQETSFEQASQIGWSCVDNQIAALRKYDPVFASIYASTIYEFKFVEAALFGRTATWGQYNRAALNLYTTLEDANADYSAGRRREVENIEIKRQANEAQFFQALVDLEKARSAAHLQAPIRPISPQNCQVQYFVNEAILNCY